MVYLRLTAPAIGAERMARLERNLREAAAGFVDADLRRWIAVQIVQAHGDVLILDVEAPSLSMRARRELAGHLTAALCAAYGLRGDDVYRAHVRFFEYDELRDAVVGFRFAGSLLRRPLVTMRKAAPLASAAFAGVAAALLANGLLHRFEQRMKGRRVGDGQFGESLAIERDARPLQPADED
jgi:hypothetical protein